MSKYYSILTRAGSVRLSNAIALSVPLALTHIALGDGAGSDVTVSDSVDSLRREVYRGRISSLVQDESNPGWVRAEISVPPDIGGWTIRELGIFDDSGVLIGYGSFPASYKPVLAEGTSKEMIIRFYLETASGGDVILKVDPAIAVASKAYVDAAVKRGASPFRPVAYFTSQS